MPYVYLCDSYLTETGFCKFLQFYHLLVFVRETHVLYLSSIAKQFLSQQWSHTTKHSNISLVNINKHIQNTATAIITINSNNNQQS